MNKLNLLFCMMMLLALFSSCSFKDKLEVTVKNDSVISKNDISEEKHIEKSNHVRLEFSFDDLFDVTDADIDEVISVLNERFNIMEITAIALNDNGSVVVLVPSDYGNYEHELVGIIEAEGLLEFKDSYDNLIFDGSAIKDASSVFGKVSDMGLDSYYVELVFKEEFVDVWADATEAAADCSEIMDESGRFKNYISVYLDGELQCSPFVEERIVSDTCIISAGWEEEYANYLAGIIKAGKLPHKIKFSGSEFVKFGD